MKIVSIGRFWHTNGTPLHFPVAFGERAMLRDVPAAQHAVAEQILQAIAGGATAVCLPGSSVPTADVDEVPEVILNASRSATVILETFVEMQRAGKRQTKTRRGWVLRDGKILRGPVRQLFHARQSGLPSSTVERELRPLVTQIDEGIDAGAARCSTGRVFPLANDVVGLLLLCGEFNAVAGGHSKTHEVGFAHGRTAAHADLASRWAGLSDVVVFNPTHTWTPQGSVVQKRRFLSSKGVYVGPTNAYARYASGNASRRCNVTQRAGEDARVLFAADDDPNGAFKVQHVELCVDEQRRG